MATEPLAESVARQVGRTEATALTSTLAALVGGARSALGQDLVGVYLTGSFALGAGDMASDVDFLVVSEHDLTTTAERRVRDLHARLPDLGTHWAHHLEGSWVSKQALRDPVRAHSPWLYVDNGSRVMEHSRHDDSWNARWVLGHGALAVAGPPASELVSSVAPGDIEAEAVEQAEAKSDWIRGDPAALLDGWAEPYVVLTLCRLLWAATYGTIVGKSEAADWVRTDVAPPEFGHLVEAAVAHRLRAFDAAANRADPTLVAVAADFVAWATHEVQVRATTDEDKTAT